jgi:hypothetical protein
MRAVLAVAVAALISACTSTPPKPFAPPPGPARNSPVTLTDADRAAIQAGVRAALAGQGNPTFRTMIATAGADGVVTVCGYVNKGSGDKPYIGTLAASVFTMASVGGTDPEIIAVHTACGHKGIHI